MTVIEEIYQWAYNPGNRSLTTHLALHHAAVPTASAQDIHSWHLANGWAGIAYHYYVRKDGSIYRGRPEMWRGGHAENWNMVSIGVCFEGNFLHEQMGGLQRESGRRLVHDIMRRHPGIIVSRHGDLNATDCPGTYFPFDYMITEFEQITPTEFDSLMDGYLDDQGQRPGAALYREAGIWAAESGLIQGDAWGNYSWQSWITREQLALALQCFYHLLSLELSSPAPEWEQPAGKAPPHEEEIFPPPPEPAASEPEPDRAAAFDPARDQSSPQQ